MIEGKAEAITKVLLDRMHVCAILIDRKTGFERSELGRRAMFIGRADEEHFVPAGPLETGVGVRRQHGTDEVTEMLYPIDVRQRGSDQVAHGRKLVCARRLVKRPFSAFDREG